MDRPAPQNRPDRVTSSARMLAIAAGLALAASSPACRSIKPEIPPARPVPTQQAELPKVGFSTEPHMANGAASANLSNSGASMAGFGPTAAPGRSNTGFGNPGAGAFGQPGTSGTMDSPATTPAAYANPTAAPTGP